MKFTVVWVLKRKRSWHQFGWIQKIAIASNHLLTNSNGNSRPNLTVPVNREKRDYVLLFWHRWGSNSWCGTMTASFRSSMSGSTTDKGKQDDMTFGTDMMYSRINSFSRRQLLERAGCGIKFSLQNRV